MHSVANVSDGSRMSLIVGSNEKQVQTQAKEQRSKLVAGAAMAVRRPPDRRKDENFGGHKCFKASHMHVVTVLRS